MCVCVFVYIHENIHHLMSPVPHSEVFTVRLRGVHSASSGSPRVPCLRVEYAEGNCTHTVCYSYL